MKLGLTRLARRVGTALTNTAPPTISGTPGATLTGTPGTFSAGTVASYWIADYIVVSLASTLDSSLYPGRSIRYESVATLGAFSASAVSAAVSAGVAGTTILSDTFTAADNTLLRSRGFTILGTTAPTQPALDNYIVKSNQATLTVNNGALGGQTPIAIVDTTSTNHSVAFDFASAALGGSPIFAAIDGSNYLGIINNGTRGGYQEFFVYSCIAGTFNYGGITYFYAPLISVGTTIKIEIINGQYYLSIGGTRYVNSAFNATPTPVVNAGGGVALPGGFPTGGTKVGVGLDSTSKVIDNFIAVNLTQVFTATAVNDTSVLPTFTAGRAVTVSGTYTGIAPTGIDLGVVDASGNVLVARTASVSPTISGGTWTASIASTALNGSFTQLNAQAWRAGDATALGVGVGFTPSVYAQVKPARIGMNESFVTPYSTSSQPRELYLASEWRDVSYHYIYPRGAAATAPDINSSVDGSGSTVKMDYDGTIYPTNGAGLSTYRLILPWQTHANRAGTYQIDFGAAVTVVAGSQQPALTPNGSGKWTFTRPAGYLSDQHIDVTSGSIPTGGVKPSIRFVADANPARAYTDEAAANFPGATIRWMNARNVNSDNIVANRTSTALPSRSPVERLTGPGTGGGVTLAREIIVGGTNQAGKNLWWNVSHLDSDALITADMNYIATNLSASKTCYIEFSNEPWNGQFTQHTDLRLGGLRRGYAPAGISLASSAITETIIDARGYVNRYTGVTTSPTASGDNLFVDVNGRGLLVYTATGAQTAGGNPVPTTGASGTGWTLKYSNTDTMVAGQRYLMSRTKEIKAIAATSFVGAGRAAPVMVLNVQCVGGFANNTQPMLDWDNGYTAMVGQRIACAPYWSGGIAGLDMGAYADASVTGWQTAQKNLAFTDLAAAKTAFFNAAPAVIDASVGVARTLKHAVAAYYFGKGQAADAVDMVAYEGQWHVVFNGWPILDSTTTSMTIATGAQIMTVATGQPYAVGNIVTITNTNAANFMTGAVTAYNSGTGALTANVTTVGGSGTFAVWSLNFPATSDLFGGLIRDSRMGTMMTRYLSNWKSWIGNEIILFNRVDVIPTSGGNLASWSLTESDTDIDVSGGGSTNWRWKAITDFATANP